MASQETPNYRLSRWAGTDRILVEEFNDNWDKIDMLVFLDNHDTSRFYLNEEALSKFNII